MVLEPVEFLLVDDREDSLDALEGLLRRDGLVLRRARTGGEALGQLLLHELALVVVAARLPDMDGFELAERMRVSPRTQRVPIILITPEPRDHDRVFQGYEKGAVDLLFEPFDPRALRGKAEVFFQLHRQHQELARALRLNEMFVGILGHDLRNPLGTIVTGTEHLERSVADPAHLRTLRRMSTAGARMARMIDQLLDLTRARLAGGVGFVRARRWLDVAELVQRSADELSDVHPDREIAVRTRGDTTTWGDADRLLQVWSNLIANAIHHGAPGAIGVEVAGADDEIVVTVQNGGAIPPAVLPTVFDPFRGRHGSSRAPRGLGLGLYISQQIAIAHGGAIAVVSTAADGTEFSVRLPRRSGPRPAGDGRRLVLIVDDDEDIRDALREAFEERGYATATAADGREALEHLARPASRPDVVILDMGLPIFDGNVVYQAMQADPALAAIPVIVSTSTPARAPGGVVVVAKPMQLADLFAAVAALWD